MASQRRWSDFSTAQQTAIIALGAVELVLTSIAAADLARRPSAQVRGPKLLWWPALAVQPTGPVAYLVWGRRR